MIDFGKINFFLDYVKVNYRNLWVEGNYEDGYLFGLDNLIFILEIIEQEFFSVVERENSNILCEQNYQFCCKKCCEIKFYFFFIF